MVGDIEEDDLMTEAPILQYIEVTTLRDWVNIITPIISVLVVGVFSWKTYRLALFANKREARRFYFERFDRLSDFAKSAHRVVKIADEWSSRNWPVEILEDAIEDMKKQYEEKFYMLSPWEAERVLKLLTTAETLHKAVDLPMQGRGVWEYVSINNKLVTVEDAKNYFKSSFIDVEIAGMCAMEVFDAYLYIHRQEPTL